MQIGGAHRILQGEIAASQAYTGMTLEVAYQTRRRPHCIPGRGEHAEHFLFSFFLLIRAGLAQAHRPQMGWPHWPCCFTKCIQPVMRED